MKIIADAFNALFVTSLFILAVLLMPVKLFLFAYIPLGIAGLAWRISRRSKEILERQESTKKGATV